MFKNKSETFIRKINTLDQVMDIEKLKISRNYEESTWCLWVFINVRIEKKTNISIVPNRLAKKDIQRSWN